MIAIFIALLLGVVFGTLTGLIPGVHVNLISAALLSYLIYFDSVENVVLMVFIVSMAITHTFLDFLPSVYLGAPDEDSFLSILPGHRMLKEGNGHEAVVLTLFGSLIALGVFLIFSGLFFIFLNKIYDFSYQLIPFLLIFVSLYFILREREFLNSFFVFALAGFLGWFVLNSPIHNSLLPLFSGLFGVSSLIVSLKSKLGLPKQKVLSLREYYNKRVGWFKSSWLSGVFASFCSFLPGLGSGHAAFLASELGEEDEKVFLFSVGAINTIVMSLSFVSLIILGRTRSGAAVAVSEILDSFGSSEIFLILFSVVFSGVLAFFIGLNVSKTFAKRINVIDYRLLSVFVILFLLGINLVFSGFHGLIVLITSTALGVYCISSNVRRINLMGVLIIPTVIFYLI